MNTHLCVYQFELKYVMDSLTLNTTASTDTYIPTCKLGTL